MAKNTGKADERVETITIGDVKASKKVWGIVNSYKTQQRLRGRKLKMPDALCELAEAGGVAKGIV